MLNGPVIRNSAAMLRVTALTWRTVSRYNRCGGTITVAYGFTNSVAAILVVSVLIFAISLVPGIFGASLGELEGQIPIPPSTTAFSGGGGAEDGPVWMKNQYKEALAKARAENKLVFINFTGNACTNCHWMKANMFPRPEIAPLLKDFVLVDLYTDGTDAASEENAKMEEQRYNTVSIPFYVILDPDEKVIATFPEATRDTQKFAAFLKSGGDTKIASKNI